MNVQYLYHGTSEFNAQRIISDKMVRASISLIGIPGPAIYFATKPDYYGDRYGLPNYCGAYGPIRFLLEPTVALCNNYRLFFGSENFHPPSGNTYSTVVAIQNHQQLPNWLNDYDELNWCQNPYFWFNGNNGRFLCRQWNANGDRSVVTLALCSDLPLQHFVEAYNVIDKQIVWSR